MDIDKINGLMKALDALKKHKDYEKISIQLSAEDLEVLVSRIYDYTVKLATDNAVELSDDELDLNNGAIINLLSYDTVTAAYIRSPEESRQRIFKHLAELLPESSEKQIMSLMK